MTTDALATRARARTRALPTHTLTALAVCFGSTLLLTVAASLLFDHAVVTIVSGFVLAAVIASLVVSGLLKEPTARASFGAANAVTTARAALVVFVASFIPVAASLSPATWWTLCSVSLVALTLDGFDGYLARRRNEASAFGARYDMEIDALLALVMSVLLWRGEQNGIWVLGLGILRYLFIAAGYLMPTLTAALFPSMRRKVVCVIQVAALCALLSPIVNGSLATLIGGVALALLVASFARDTGWLLTKGGKTSR